MGSKSNMLIKLHWLIYHTLSVGFFPNNFKTATIIIILGSKSNTDHAIKSKMVSSLEVTGKFMEKISKRLR